MNKIDENLDLFEYKNKSRTDLTKLDENWDQKGILTYIFLRNKENYTKYKVPQYVKRHNSITNQININ